MTTRRKTDVRRLPVALLAGLTGLVALVAAGCLDSKVSDEDADRIRAAVQREVDGVTVVEVRDRDALERCCGFDLVVRSATSDPAGVRADTRAVAEVVWRNAPDGVNGFSVANRVGPKGCRTGGTAECWTDYLGVSAESAPWLWGDPDDAGSPPASARPDDESCPAGPDLAVAGQGFDWDRLTGFAPDLTATLLADYGHSQARIERAAGEVARFVWACYPARLATFTLTVQETAPAATGTATPPDPDELRAPTFRYSAADLAARFGDRPPGLPR